MFSLLLLGPLFVGDLPLSGPPARPAAEVRRLPNVLLVVLDDVGTREFDFYGEGNDYPALPNIGELAARGLRFENLWTNPSCSPTRATILTGRYSQRTKIGKAVNAGSIGIDPGEVLLPDMLPSEYATALIGKWHLTSVAQGPTGPNDFGFDYFAGILFNLGGLYGYYNWPRVEQGVQAISNQYLTSAQVDDAAAWIAGQSGPWFCSLNFTAGHGPWDEYPPEHLHGEHPGLQDYGTPRSIYRAMLEAVDTELGRLLRVVSLEDTLVFFLSDDGTPKSVLPPWSLLESAKGTVLEGGVNVPMVVAGPWIQPGTCSALVHTVDFPATLLEICGGEGPTAIDSVSFAPHLLDPDLPSVHTHLFAEFFSPNGDGPYDKERYAVRDERYKLTRVNGLEKLFDLELDPKEQVNLIADPALAAITEALRAELDAYLALE